MACQASWPLVEGLRTEKMNDPVTMRRQLVGELRRLRDKSGLTQRQVADALDWSQSKIIRIEKASVAIGITDLQALLRIYGVDDPAAVGDLEGMARGSKRLPFNEFRVDFAPETLRYFRYESTSSIIRQFEPLIVPGLLQTEEYGRSLLHGLVDSEKRIDTVWASRAERQELLDREAVPEMFFILGEAAVRQTVGTEGVMRRQRERLVELNNRDRISVQVLPFSAEANIGMQGPFAYLEFAAESDANVLYAEATLGDSVIRDDEDLTGEYLEHFFKLERLALPAADLERFLATLP
jgi:transcriptional regulator with XRE-family HTH domain